MVFTQSAETDNSHECMYLTTCQQILSRIPHMTHQLLWTSFSTYTLINVKRNKRDAIIGCLIIKKDDDGE